MVNQRLYFYHLEQLTLEIEGEQSLTLLRGADQPLAERHGINSGADTRLLMTDAQHSLLLMQSGQARMAYAYTAYGHDPRSEPAAARLGFNGECREPLTGAYLLGQGYRGYYPPLMRFLAPDGLSPFDEGGLNAYGYCQGDPINYSDPTGHFTVKQLINRRRIQSATRASSNNTPPPSAASALTPRKPIERVQLPQGRDGRIKRLITRPTINADTFEPPRPFYETPTDYELLYSVYNRSKTQNKRVGNYVNYMSRQQITVSTENGETIRKITSRYLTMEKLYNTYLQANTIRRA